MTPLQRFVQYVIIANAILNMFSFVNVKPDLARFLNPSPVGCPVQVRAENP
ncbi:MAG: hypothetical protein ACK5CA_11440 [Cyanobacteriota bacterium]|jgi:hypothetical protein